jgi:NAD(P)-dependent dehydrogenase (short-subunit alcohol dehydrogenase family)
MDALAEGEIAVVTGGASGIGRAVALAFAHGGARVAVADIDVDGGEETARLVRAAGSDAIFVRTDVTRPADVCEMINRTVASFGGLTCAVNNAGIEGVPARIVDCTDEQWSRVLAVNLTGVFSCMRHELQHFVAHGGGVIVNVASVAGLVGFANSPAYVASKHGVVGLTKAAALDYAHAGIRINAVCPGVIATPMIDRFTGGVAAAVEQLAAIEPVGRLGTPEEVAALVVWLCSKQATFVTGAAIPIDGGYTTG